MESAADLAPELGFAESFDGAVERARTLGGDRLAATAASGVDVERRIRRLESVELSTGELSDHLLIDVKALGNERDLFRSRFQQFGRGTSW